MGSMIFGPEGAAKEKTYTLLDEYLKLGGNCIDTALIYAGGNSERAIGMWLADRGTRDRVIILDKGCHPNGPEPRVTPEAVREDIAINLQRLNTPFIDVWMS